ncbi:MAG: hypothetical protein Q7K43_04530 [Candidatus Woesearchaeota archaeon]|nr:hypothetical protein [Candidatus Woesearchaeota archaeon]
MQWPFKQELGRKILHLSATGYIITYWFFSWLLNAQAGLYALLAMLMVFLFLEYLRLDCTVQVPIFSWMYSKYRRKNEKRTLGGEIFLISSVLIVFAVFSPAIATVASLMAVFGDTVAALVLYVSRIKLIRYRMLEASIAEFAINILVGGVVSIFLPLTWPVIVSMALIATIVETLTFKVPDNFVIPLLSAGIGQLLVFLGV